MSPQPVNGHRLCKRHSHSLGKARAKQQWQAVAAAAAAAAAAGALMATAHAACTAGIAAHSLEEVCSAASAALSCSPPISAANGPLGARGASEPGMSTVRACLQWRGSRTRALSRRILADVAFADFGARPAPRSPRFSHLLLHPALTVAHRPRGNRLSSSSCASELRAPSSATSRAAAGTSVGGSAGRPLRPPGWAARRRPAARGSR